jgi:copper homeostasis protein (lipoprotein)
MNRMKNMKTLVRRSLKFTLTAAVVAVLIMSCVQTGKNRSKQAKVIDGHTSEISLDWAGIYSGILPCADCEGIETELILNEDGTYVLTTEYLGKRISFGDTIQGKFTWQGNNVHLEGIPKHERSSLFKVEENQVRYLDVEGNVVTGVLENHYILKKEGNILVEDKRWHLIELNGHKVEGTADTHFLIFDSKERKAQAKVNCNIILLSYKIKNELILSFGPGATTMMACPDTLEDEYLRVLEMVDNLSTDGKTLSLNKARMAPLARFELAE